MRLELRGLYIIIDPEMAPNREEVSIARAALRGGARLIQFRDKRRAKGTQLPIIRDISRLCREAKAPLIVNDDVDLALSAGADGVHVGKDDLPVEVVRNLVPSRMLVGCSANNLQEALRAEKAGADYVSVGCLFPTYSKSNARPASLETLRSVKKGLSVPVCGIGGITSDNIKSVLDCGVEMAAVIRAVVSAPNVENATRALATLFPYLPNREIENGSS